MRNVALATMCFFAASCASSTPLSRSPTSHPPRASTGRALKLVSYDGVQIEVPTSWPVVGGNLAPDCDPVWPAAPTVFVGSQPEGGAGCSARAGASSPYDHLDGVWLRPATDGMQPPEEASGGTTYTLPSGQQVEESVPGPVGPGSDLLFHQVWLQLGARTPASLASGVLDSLTYVASAPDTAVFAACTTKPATIPAPTRLDHQMILNQGNVILDPPSPDDQPAVSATVATKTVMIGQMTTQGEELLLARYSSKLPATQEPNGSLKPMEQHVLAWVLYSYPLSPTVTRCGLWGVNAYNALTGAGVTSSGWAPGP